jgi:hypothetical protein
MSSLSILHMNSIRFNGALPTTIGQLSNLQYMYILSTSLQGTIPTSIGCLTKLTRFLLAYSSFTGMCQCHVSLWIAVFSYITSPYAHLKRSFSLYIMYICTCVPGSIPTTIGAMSSLSIMFIQSVRFNGALPTTIGRLSNLQSLYIETTCLQGTIPTSIGCLTKLTMFGLTMSLFTGMCHDYIHVTWVYMVCVICWFYIYIMLRMNPILK